MSTVTAADLIERGIYPIPDNEVTDKGEYVLWNEYDPTKHALLTIPPETISSYYPLLTECNSEYIAALADCKLAAYPGKTVRVEGLFECQEYRGSRWSSNRRPATVAFYVSGSRQLVKNLNTQNNLEFDHTLPLAQSRRVTTRDLTPELRSAYAYGLYNIVYNSGHMPDGAVQDRHSLLINEMARIPSAPLCRTRGVNMAADTVLRVKRALKTLGEIIGDAGSRYASEFIDALDEVAYPINEVVRLKAINAWNSRCDSSEEVELLSCDHIATASESTPTADGEVCDHCLNEFYTVPEDDGTYYRIDDLYEHDDGQYYTYQQEDEYDEDDEDSDRNSTRLIRGYSTNVLSTLAKDESIRVSPYGEFLMGIELEVEADGSRSMAASHTNDALCRNYAILKHDGSLDEDHGFEIVTAPRGLKEHIKRFTEWEVHSSLTAWDAGCCGMHVHLSSGAFTQATLGKFIEFINSPANDDFIKSIAGRHPKDGGSASSYCQREGDIVAGNPKKTLQEKSGDRYRMINTQNMNFEEATRLGLSRRHDMAKPINTVELRIFRASLKKERLLAQIEFAHAAVMFCRWSSMRELRGKHFLLWLRKSAGVYPHLAKWFGVRTNKTVESKPYVFAETATA